MKKHYIKTKNGTIFCKVFGEGTPIIFLHGGPGMFHDYFLPHFDKLAQNNMLIFYDQNGSGMSSIEDTNLPITINDLVDTLKDIADYFNLDKFHCISHSFGALVALNFMLKYPNMILSNIMISPAPGNDTYDKEGQRNLLNRVSEDDMLIMRDLMSSNPFENQDMEAINKLVKIREKGRYFAPSFLDKSTFSFTWDYITKLQIISAKLNDELDNYDLYDLISDIMIKTLIIHGSYDAIPLESSERYHEKLANSKLIVIDRSGHFPFVERNAKIIEIISEYL